MTARPDPALDRVAQHQALRVEPAALVEQAPELAAHGAVVVDRALVVDGGDEPLVGDVQQRHPRALVHAAALRLDDAVLDLVGDAQAVAAADAVGLQRQLDAAGERLAVERHREALLEAHRDLLGLDVHRRVPVLDSHDGLHDAQALVQELEVLGFVGGAPDVGVGRVGLLHAHLVGELARGEPLAHLLAPAHLAHEVLVQPRLVDAQRRVGHQAVAVEPLDVVALVGGAVAPDVDAVLLHGLHQHRARDRAAQGCGVEVGAPGRRDVERAALQGDEALVDERLAAIDQARLLGAVERGAARDVVVVALVGLREVGGVGVGDGAVVAHPGEGGGGVEAAGEGDPDALALGQGQEDFAHGGDILPVAARTTRFSRPCPVRRGRRSGSSSWRARGRRSRRGPGSRSAA